MVLLPLAMGPLAGAKISVEPSTDILFMRPGRRDAREESTDPHVQGFVMLSLARPTKILKVTVRVDGSADISNGSAMTHGHLFEREASLVREETTLEAGETRWRFDLTLSSSMACFERNRHGIVQYFLSAEATAIGWLEASVRSVIRPILPNAEVSSQIRIRRPLAINAVPDLTETPVYPLNLEIEQLVPELGPTRVVLRCVSLHIGAPILTEIIFASPEAPLILLAVSLHINQSLLLFPFPSRDPYEPPVERVPIYRLTATTLPSEIGADAFSLREEAIRQGVAHTVKHIDRLPDRDALSATSLPGCETPMQVSHEVKLDIDFQLPNGVRRRATVMRPVTMASCASLPENMLVPEYAAECNEVRITKLGPTKGKNRFALSRCACEISREDAIARDREQLLSPSLPQDAVRTGPKQI